MKRCVAALLAAALAGPVAVAAADQLLFNGRTSYVTGTAGLVAWSSCADLSNSRHCRLRYLLGGRLSFAAVPEQRPFHGFDVDAGLDGRGRRTLIYSRCGGRGVGEYAPNTRKGCRLFVYRPGDRREHRVRVPVPKGQSAYEPAIDGDRIVYFTSRSTDEPKRSDRPVMNIWDGRHVRRMRIGTYLPADPDTDFTTPDVGPVRVDAAGGEIALIWLYQAQGTASGCGSNDLDEADALEAWIVEPDGQRHRVETTGKRCRPPGAIDPGAVAITGDGTTVVGGYVISVGDQVARFAPDGNRLSQAMLADGGGLTGFGSYGVTGFVYGTDHEPPNGIFVGSSE